MFPLQTECSIHDIPFTNHLGLINWSCVGSCCSLLMPRRRCCCCGVVVGGFGVVVVAPFYIGQSVSSLPSLVQTSVYQSTSK